MRAKFVFEKFIKIQEKQQANVPYDESLKFTHEDLLKLDELKYGYFKNTPETPEEKTARFAEINRLETKKTTWNDIAAEKLITEWFKPHPSMVPKNKTDAAGYIIGENGRRVKMRKQFYIYKDLNPELLPDNALRVYLNSPFGINITTYYDYVKEEIERYDRPGYIFVRNNNKSAYISDMISTPDGLSKKDQEYCLATRYIPKEWIDRLAGKGDIFDTTLNKTPGSGFTESFNKRLVREHLYENTLDINKNGPKNTSGNIITHEYDGIVIEADNINGYDYTPHESLIPENKINDEGFLVDEHGNEYFEISDHPSGFSEYNVVADVNPERIPDSVVRVYLNEKDGRFGADLNRYGKTNLETVILRAKNASKNNINPNNIGFIIGRYVTKTPNTKTGWKDNVYMEGGKMGGEKPETIEWTQSKRNIDGSWERHGSNTKIVVAQRFIPYKYAKIIAGKGDIFDTVFKRNAESGFTESFKRRVHKKRLYEKFEEDSDPIKDMRLGLQKTVNNLLTKYNNNTLTFEDINSLYGYNKEYNDVVLSLETTYEFIEKYSKDVDNIIDNVKNKWGENILNTIIKDVKRALYIDEDEKHDHSNDNTAKLLKTLNYSDKDKDMIRRYKRRIFMVEKEKSIYKKLIERYYDLLKLILVKLNTNNKQYPNEYLDYEKESIAGKPWNSETNPAHDAWGIL